MLLFSKPSLKIEIKDSFIKHYMASKLQKFFFAKILEHFYEKKEFIFFLSCFRPSGSIWLKKKKKNEKEKEKTKQTLRRGLQKNSDFFLVFLYVFLRRLSQASLHVKATLDRYSMVYHLRKVRTDLYYLMHEDLFTLSLLC